jgi:hypothetical protein
MQIQVEVKNVYGTQVVYPICPAAVWFARIAGTKTLTLDTLNCIKALGYAVEVKQQIFEV